MIAEKMCLWCGDGAATTSREIEPAKINTKTKRVERAAKVVDVCPQHAAMVDRNIRVRELEKEIRTIDSLLKRGATGPRRRVLVEKRGRHQLELAELQS